MENPKAVVHKQKCYACGGCIAVCPQDAITMIAGKAEVEHKKCIRCEICINTCPVAAISWEEE
ncbi:MAG: 4Fe-4S binding protein [Candidatus Thermoplasmatota archaeon]